MWQFGIHAIQFDDDITSWCWQSHLKPSGCMMYGRCMNVTMNAIHDNDDDNDDDDGGDDDDDSLRRESVAIRHESRQLPH